MHSRNAAWHRCHEEVSRVTSIRSFVQNFEFHVTWADDCHKVSKVTPMRPISSSHRCLLKKRNNFLSLNESSSDVTWGSSCYYHSSSMKAKALKKIYYIFSWSPRWNKATNKIIVLTQKWPFLRKNKKKLR